MSTSATILTLGESQAIVTRGSGSTVDFDEFYRTSYRRIVGQLYPILGALPDAEDAAQEAFISASRAWDVLATYDNPEAWVRRVALNQAKNIRRRAQRKSRAIIRMAGGQQHVPEIDLGHPELTIALRGIAMRYRIVLTMHYLLDLPISAIATELELTESTVKTRLVRGRQRLKSKFLEQERGNHDHR
jgi:RNA polymerase sigma-70 factor, ECF subfamily